MKNFSSGSHFLSLFFRYLFDDFFYLYALWLSCGSGGGGGAYFAKKIDLSVFNLRLLYINKQYDVLISDMISKIVYECLIKSSEYFLLFFV